MPDKFDSVYLNIFGHDNVSCGHKNLIQKKKPSVKSSLLENFFFFFNRDNFFGLLIFFQNKYRLN